MDVIIPDDLFPYFEIYGTRKNYAPGEMIRPEAQNNERLYLVESGRVRVYCSNASGRELTLRIMGKGRLIGEDVFVEFTGAKTAVSAVNEVTVVSCSVEELFPYIVESEALLRAILRHLTGTNISLTRHLKRIAIYDSRQKMASYLYEETREDSPSRNIVDHVLPYSHDQLSVCLGLNRVTVSRILDEFREKGYISTAYRKIQVCDFEGLRREFEDSDEM